MGYPGLFLRIARCGREKGELGGGGREILEPDPHESYPHPALTGLEENLLQRLIENKVPEALIGELCLACDLHLIRISKYQTGFAGKQCPASESTSTLFHQLIKNSQQYPVIVLVSRKGDLFSDRGPDTWRVHRGGVYAKGPLVDDVACRPKTSFRLPMSMAAISRTKVIFSSSRRVLRRTWPIPGSTSTFKGAIKEDS
jgi:hypothetical protein